MRSTDLIFNTAERHAKAILSELEPGLGADADFERIIGVLVLMCLTKPGNDGAANINAMIANASWRLLPAAGTEAAGYKRVGSY